MVPTTQIALLAVLLVDSCAFRVRPKQRGQGEKNVATASAVTAQAALERQEPENKLDEFFVGPHPPTVAQGEPGQVDFVFNLGAPGLASPGLHNQRGSSSCFQGMRIYHSEAGDWWGEWIDIVTRIGNFVYYWHSWMPSMKIDTKGHKSHEKPCNLEQTWKPSTIDPSTSLHDQERYIESVQKVFNDPWYTNISVFSARKSYIQNPEEVYQLVQQMGWGLVGSAIHSGGSVYGGKHIAHLIQYPSTNECVLTFQGTASIQGWITNFHFASAHYCGLVDEDESCSFTWGTCSTRHARGSFVHAGLKDRVTSITKSSEWQNNIRPHLSSCSRLVATGHSLGGAVAELFSACASKAPQPGQYGYEDYQHIAWTKGAAARLSYIT